MIITSVQILEIMLSIGLLANVFLFLYQIIRIRKSKINLEESDTGIEGITFKDIVDKIPAHIYWKDLEGRCLGASELQYRDLGLTKEEYVGKTDFELFSPEIAGKIVMLDKEVLSTGVSAAREEVSPRHDGQERLYLSYKIPLKNKKEKIIALLGVSIDINDIGKQAVERKNLLESIIALMPGHIYWCDRNHIWQGCNDLQAKHAGFSSRFDIVGKRNHELPWNISNPEIALEVDQTNEEIMSSGKIKVLEEYQPSVSGEIGTCLSAKAALYDSDGKIAGMLGISIDITEKKKAEQALKEAKEKAEAMNAAALQVAHDIRSPLAAIMMLTQACSEIPEAKRVCLREAVERIHDIADQLLTKHRKHDALSDNDFLSSVLISTALLSVIASKRVEYQYSRIKIYFEASDEAYFVFIRANIIELKRMVSNLINNAMEAFHEDVGEIRIALTKNESHVILKIIDMGRGMSEEKIQKIFSDDVVTTEKENGFGLGLTHAKKMLKKFNARLNIYSSPMKGTVIELIFPLVTSPRWMASSININAEDCVIVLDDDQSIHGAWDEIFSQPMRENSALKLIHFTHADACIEYIESCAHPEKLMLLTDYELIGQLANGLDVIESAKVSRAVLVTSHYENQKVIKRSMRLNTKILPKMLASHIKLAVTKQRVESDLIDVDLVLLDDDDWFGLLFKSEMQSRGKTMKHYNNPQTLLEEISRYSRNTKICTDFELGASINGLEVAKILHQQGFVNLYLATGHRFKQEDVPDYLCVLQDRLDILKI